MDSTETGILSSISHYDEDLQRSDLQRMLQLVWPELEIIAACDEGNDALDAFVKLQPDIDFSVSVCPN